jgi:uncharacterized lipoprotein YmbA
MPSRRLSLFALMATAVLFGCSALSPRPERTRFVLLAPVTPGQSNRGRLAGGLHPSSLSIGLGPVRLPEYLDRPELVIRTSPNGFDLSDIDRWAEPLADNFRHVLANDLATTLGTNQIVQYPWYAGTRLDYVVRVQVERFEADTNHTAVLVARWNLRTAKAGQALAAREAHFSHPLTSLTGDSIAAALSSDLEDLATQITSAVVQAEQQRLARGES